MARRYLINYENDKGAIDLAGMARLATVLRVPMAYLVAEDDIIADAIMVLSKLTYEDRRILARRLRLEADTFAGRFVGESKLGD